MLEIEMKVKNIVFSFRPCLGGYWRLSRLGSCSFEL